MHCIYCGTALPDVAAYCGKCGKARPGSQESAEGHSPVEVGPSGRGNAVSSSVVPRPSSYKWAFAYGWLFVLAAAYLLISAIVTLIAGVEATPAAVPGATRSIGLASAIGQGALFLATGLAILQRRVVAVRLVWVSTIFAGLGVVLRGLIPLDGILWLATFALAKWFSGKRPLLVKQVDIHRV
jgi:hypothetical protein